MPFRLETRDSVIEISSGNNCFEIVKTMDLTGAKPESVGKVIRAKSVTTPLAIGTYLRFKTETGEEKILRETILKVSGGFQ